MLLPHAPPHVRPSNEKELIPKTKKEMAPQMALSADSLLRQQATLASPEIYLPQVAVRTAPQRHAAKSKSRPTDECRSC
jgi:hypothetical protein